jgi:uracil-DNA glycosylase family 4
MGRPRQKPLSCQGCPLEKIGVGFGRPEGTGTNGVLIVGEALGASEAADSLPFRPYAASGAILERALRKSGLDRQAFVLFNVVNCQPPGNKLEGKHYEAGAVEHCRQHLAQVITQYRPSVIVALGNVALKNLTGMVGRNRSISHLRGFVLSGVGLGARGIPTVASYHPAFLARGAKNLLGVLMQDLQTAVWLAGQVKEGQEVSHDKGTYEVSPSVGAALRYLEFLRDRPELSVSYDIETDFSHRETDESEIFGGTGDNITQVQFSHTPRQGIVFPWRGEYKEIAKAILALPNPKWHWNGWAFDDPRLEREGAIINGESHDLMWAWHHLQPDLPRGLQFVTSFYSPLMPPWKHTSDSDIREYGAADVDSVQRIGVQLFGDLRADGVLSGYQRHIFSLWPILKRMCARGLPIDLEARRDLGERVIQEKEKVDAEIQLLVPLDVRGVHPKLGYKVVPAGVRELCREHGIATSGKSKALAYPPELKQRVLELFGLKCREFDGGGERFYRELEFLPNSSDQLKAYMRFRGHKVPVKLKEVDDDGNLKETTEKKELERLYQRTKDPLYNDIITSRELGKIYSTYVEGWQIGPDGRVHSTFTFATGSGQLSSRNPNIQNAPKVGDLADAFRRTIRAREGFRLVAIDWTAFHALTLGFCARDPDYMRLARLDIHSYLAGHLLKLPGRDRWLQLPDRELAGVLDSIKGEHKTVRNKKAKPTVLGYGFGLGASKLYDMNVESFESKKEAQGIIDLLNGLFPRTAQFREDIKEQAHAEGRLLSPYGYHRRFWDVYGWQEVSAKYEPKWGEKLFKGRDGKIRKRVTGDEGEAAIAYLPANTAYGHAKEVVLECEARGYLERYGLINWVHDELLFECPIDLVDDCVRDVSREMEARSNVLVDAVVAPLGLACGVEASVGQDWQEMKMVYKTPLEVLT